MHQLTQVARGVKTVLTPGALRRRHLLELTARWRVPTMSTVPMILKMMVEDASVDAFDHSLAALCRLGAGAPMFREDQKWRGLGPGSAQYCWLGEVTGAGSPSCRPSITTRMTAPEVRLATCGLTDRHAGAGPAPRWQPPRSR